MSGIPFLVLAVAAGYLFAGSVRVWDAWLFRPNQTVPNQAKEASNV